MRQHGLRISADLVHHLAGPSQSAVTAHNHQIHQAELHQTAGGVVRNHLMRNSLLRQLPSRQRRALGTRPRLTAKNVEPLPLLLRRVHRSGSRTIIDEGQPACVAMSQQSRARPNQPGAARSQGAALFHAGLSELSSGNNGGGLLVFNGGSAANPLANPSERIGRIHRSGTSIRQRGKHLALVPIKSSLLAAGKLPQPLRISISGGGGNRAGAANNHVRNRLRRLPITASAHNFKPMRQQSLFNKNNPIVFLVKRNRLVMAMTPLANVDFHKLPNSLITIRNRQQPRRFFLRHNHPPYPYPSPKKTHTEPLLNIKN